MTQQRKSDPIRRVVLASGEIRYRFVIDLGKKPDGRRDQRTFTYRTLKEARSERARIISERSVGTLVRPNRKLTVAEYFAEWLTSKAGKKPSTQQCYRDALRPLLDLYGHLPLQALDVPHLERIKRGLVSGELRKVGRPGKPLAPRTVNLFLTTVEAGLQVAVKRRLISMNPAECVEHAASDPDAGADRGLWQLEEVRQFLTHVRDHRLYAAFLLSCCGLRRGEVLGLTWQDVTLTGDSPTLAVRTNRVQVAGKIHLGSPKSRASRRTLPLPLPLVAALGDLQVRQREEIEAAGPAYCNADGRIVVDELGAAYRPEWYSDEFTRQVRAAGLPRIPLHGARHAAASLLGALGLPLVAVGAWLGQSQISVTAGYQHAGTEVLAEVSERFTEALAL